MNQSKLTRRRFLYIIIAAVISVLAGNFIFTSFEHVVGKIIIQQLSFLKLDENAIAQFTKDIKKFNYYDKKSFDWKKKVFVRTYYFLDYTWLPLPGKNTYKKYSDFFVEDFLLSTNFFINKMNEDMVVEYTTLYEPYKNACSHPFSNLYYPNI